MVISGGAPSVSAPHSEIKSCPQGHEYSEENTYVDPRGWKHCKACRRERMRARRPGTVGRGGRNSLKKHCPKGHPYSQENTRWYKNRRACITCARANSTLQNIKRYGITREEFEALLIAQAGCCVICELPFGESTPHIDHDHACCPKDRSCGKCVRGLLCGDCNRGLGLFRDSSERLQRAAIYMTRWTTTNP